ncbi:poly(A) polymerase [Sphaerochaeta globosa]|uniref:Poly(A) polymerase n=1 Tax=Sphaerochaeta globosa (strain ATCC BAA-1886 / DSM 22777 / Buddy) TaxID=158189 RepID=F0RVU4_SPHGB|nr:poly(A) polymerase [Sphaerochaeta globosa]ADY13156.1 poly(A) polymerase [Sphaerochaeta globosa str. Buddy]
MLIRYKQDELGKTLPVANIYTQSEHKIPAHLLDKDALWAIKKLQASGAEAYLVGGAVRDMMLGTIPKDFDIATSASPRQIQRLFWNARIIGKRFKLVHLVFKDKVLEVSTFRSGEEAMDGNNNVFGSIDQDAKRRDFSINSFYYDPSTGQLLDFNHAMEDFKKKKISSIIDLDESFKEDPVRMVRAIKYSVSTGFSLRWSVKMAIRKYSNELSRVSTSRLTEEVNKILASGHSCEIFNELKRYKLLVFMLPAFSIYSSYPQVQSSLKELDKQVLLAKQGKGSEVLLADMLKALVDPLIVFTDEALTIDQRFKETFRQIKVLISPMTPSNYDIELASERLLCERGFKTPRNCVRVQRPANRIPGRRPPLATAQRKARPEVSAEGAKKRRTRNRGPKKSTGSSANSQALNEQSVAQTSAEVHDL